MDCLQSSFSYVTFYRSCAVSKLLKAGLFERCLYKVPNQTSYITALCCFLHNFCFYDLLYTEIIEVVQLIRCNIKSSSAFPFPRQIESEKMVKIFVYVANGSL